MRGLHPYAIIFGFLIGMAAFAALKLPPLAIAIGVGGTIAVNEGMKRRFGNRINRDKTDHLDDDRRD